MALKKKLVFLNTYAVVFNPINFSYINFVFVPYLGNCNIQTVTENDKFLNYQYKYLHREPSYKYATTLKS